MLILNKTFYYPDEIEVSFDKKLFLDERTERKNYEELILKINYLFLFKDYETIKKEAQKFIYYLYKYNNTTHTKYYTGVLNIFKKYGFLNHIKEIKSFNEKSNSGKIEVIFYDLDNQKFLYIINMSKIKNHKLYNFKDIMFCIVKKQQNKI